MKRRLVSAQTEAAEVNITPLLDIVFILLIFFIVTATFLQEVGIGLIAPQDEPPEEERRPPPTMVLTVQKDGFVLVDDVRLVDPRSVKPIVEAFKAAKPLGVVLVSAAPESRVESTVLVIDQTRLAGVDPAIALQRTTP
jgi:biopolymer transport protein ExbD